MRLQTWERYVPDVGDNRAKFAAGAGAWTVMLRRPTAAVWLGFWQAVAESPKWGPKLSALKQEYGDQVGTAVAARLASMDAELGAKLWLPCVGAIEGFPDLGEKTPKDGAALWALRDELDDADVFADLFDAILRQTVLDEGLAHFLASRSAPQPSHATALEPAGVAATTAGSSPS